MSKSFQSDLATAQHAGQLPSFSVPCLSWGCCCVSFVQCTFQHLVLSHIDPRSRHFRTSNSAVKEGLWQKPCRRNLKKHTYIINDATKQSREQGNLTSWNRPRASIVVSKVKAASHKDTCSSPGCSTCDPAYC